MKKYKWPIGPYTTVNCTPIFQACLSEFQTTNTH